MSSLQSTAKYLHYDNDRIMPSTDVLRQMLMKIGGFQRVSFCIYAYFNFVSPAPFIGSKIRGIGSPLVHNNFLKATNTFTDVASKLFIWCLSE